MLTCGAHLLCLSICQWFMPHMESALASQSQAAKRLLRHNQRRLSHGMRYAAVVMTLSHYETLLM